MAGNKRKKQRGTTVVEAMVTVIILVVTLLPALGSMQSTVDTQRSLVTRDLLEERVRLTAERLLFHVKGAGLDTLVNVPELPQTSQTMTYRRVVGFDSVNGPLWSPTMVASFANGRLTLNVGGTVLRLGHTLTNVTFSLDGKNLRIDIRADGIGPKGEQIDAARRIQVTLQN